MKGPPRTAAGGARLGEPRLRWLREVWRSTIGKKVIVAITGMVLVGYVVLHALGNLKALQGNGGTEEAPIDKYAEWLRTLGEPVIPEDGVLWAFRVLLLSAFVIHIAGVAQLWQRNREARPAGHRNPKVLGRSISSRTMLFTGGFLLVFVVFHILQFTTGTIETTPIEIGDVYANLYFAFQKWYFVVLYIAAVVMLGFHLWHALWSVSQTAGFDKPNRNRTIRRAGTTTAAAVTLFFAAIPLAFWTDILDPPTPTAEEIFEQAHGAGGPVPLEELTGLSPRDALRAHGNEDLRKVLKLRRQRLRELGCPSIEGSKGEIRILPGGVEPVIRCKKSDLPPQGDK